MPLTKTQQVIWEKARAYGAGGQAVRLTDEMCAYLVGRIAFDLGLQSDFPEIPSNLQDFFEAQDSNALIVGAVDARALFERLVRIEPDADMFFACLAALHKARLKYQVILATQPIPTLEQVGPRGLLQFGKLRPTALVGLLFWRKWFFDIDNRAAQETGYLFEPVIAYAIGGTPVPARNSPIKRHQNRQNGRQVDCLLGGRAYELKLRVTTAASGQGRWREELDFPIDCIESGYKPVLVVLDGTPNPKLLELEEAFTRQGGEVFTGAAAWAHLDSLAGATMARFLAGYVREPIERLMRETPQILPEFAATIHAGGIDITVGGETLRILRREAEAEDDDHDRMPEDIGDAIPG